MTPLNNYRHKISLISNEKDGKRNVRRKSESPIYGYIRYSIRHCIRYFLDNPLFYNSGAGDPYCDYFFLYCLWINLSPLI